MPVDPAAERLAGVLKDPNGLDFTVGFVDGVMRPEDLRVAGRNLAARRAEASRRFLPWYLRGAIRLGGVAGPGRCPWVVIPIARRVLREMVGHLVVDATPTPSSARAIAKLAQGRHPAQPQPARRGRARRARGRPPPRGHPRAARPRRRRLRLDQGLLDGRASTRCGPSTRPSSTSSSSSPRSTSWPPPSSRGRSSSTSTWRSTATST